MSNAGTVIDAIGDAPSRSPPSGRPISIELHGMNTMGELFVRVLTHAEHETKCNYYNHVFFEINVAEICLGCKCLEMIMLEFAGPCVGLVPDRESYESSR
jgi:hypothetical protein